MGAAHSYGYMFPMWMCSHAGSAGATRTGSTPVSHGWDNFDSNEQTPPARDSETQSVRIFDTVRLRLLFSLFPLAFLLGTPAGQDKCKITFQIFPRFFDLIMLPWWIH